MSHSNSIREVASRAGVSVGTVSNVLNRPDLVSAATKDRVNTAIEDLGFVRNESARQLRAGRSRTLGLVVQHVANPYFTDLSRGVDSIADAAGLAVMLCNCDGAVAKEQRYLSLLEEQRAQALLITPIGVSNGRLAQLQRRGMAVVLLDQSSLRSDLCSVCVDDVTGGDLAASHLISTGHRQLAYVTGPSSTKHCRDRRDGALRAIRTAGLGDEALTVLEQSALGVPDGQAAAQRVLEMRPRPTALFCANDLLALGAMRGLLDRGLKLPDDMAIIGYGDIDYATSASIPITSVRQPRELLGRTAAELALEEAEEPDRHKHRHVIFQPELILRTSG